MADKKPRIYFILNYAIALVWLINGLFCKLLNFVPRHQQIVARILGEEHSFLLTKTIGVLEILMAIWIISDKKPHICAVIQILLIIIMNAIELMLAPDLLLFGFVNFCLALLLVFIIYLIDRNLGGAKSTYSK